VEVLSLGATKKWSQKGDHVQKGIKNKTKRRDGEGGKAGRAVAVSMYLCKGERYYSHPKQKLR